MEGIAKDAAIRGSVKLTRIAISKAAKNTAKERVSVVVSKNAEKVATNTFLGSLAGVFERMAVAIPSEGPSAALFKYGTGLGSIFLSMAVGSAVKWAINKWESSR
jgi:hypothetical protein